MDKSIFNEDLYGTRSKIGLIYIASSWVMEPEFYEMSPEGVITCTTRVALPGDVSVDSEEKVGERAIVAAGVLGEAPLDVITLGCTSASFVKGEAYERELVRKMQEASGGIPCTTTTSAVMKGLEAFEAKKIAVMTPYIDEVNDKAKEFLTGKGFTITNFTGMGLIKDHDIDNVTLEEIYEAALAVDTPDADAIFIACTAFKSIPIIDALEKELGKPVISSIQATFWECLRMTGVEDKIEGYGSLFNY